MQLDNGAWVVTLDGERFLLLRNQGDEEIMDLRVLDHDEIENPPTHEQGVERPGRLNDAGIGRSAVAQTDWHALEKERFAKDIADRLRHWALDGRFRSLVIVADPQTLGAIRPQLHVTVRNRVVGEINKDLTPLPIDEIEKVIRAA